MFDHRLGLALGKTVGEVRQLSAEEYRSWQLYQALEPFGWPDREYRTGVQLAMIYNVNRDKKADAKNAPDFMRNMIDEILKGFEVEEEKIRYDQMTSEEKRAYVIERAKGIFGKVVIT